MDKKEVMLSRDKNIHQLFEESSAKVPDAIAVVYKNQHISYDALNKKANQLAHYLRSVGIEAESRVGIALPRGVELIAGLLAILKSGGAYVPLDIDYPQERLAYMLDDSQVKLLLTIKGVKLPESYRGDVAYLDEEILYCKQSTDNLCITLSPENLAYIVYTSGSTGRPKGVACHHRSVVNRLYWGWDNYGFKKEETCCLQSSIAFVDSTWDIFGTLLVGAKLVLYKETVSKNIEELLKTCFLHKITRITLIPSFLNALIDFNRDKLNTLTKYLSHWEITGESFKPNLIDHFFKHMGEASTLLDCYGASEATSVIYRDYVGKNGFTYQTKILSNTQIYLLDAHLNLVPTGFEGEVYIGGVGVARGYLNKPGLTAERFIPNPFEAGSRLYRTGDLARFRPDGNIEFLGRIDHQVKLRGFRIELGEIEETIEISEAVQQAIVLCREDVPGHKRLVAYVVARRKEDGISLEYLQSLCQSRLPDYMQPSQWVVLESWPLTGTGKIDRKGLSAPEGREGLGVYQAPEGLMEEQLAKIWSELLGIEIGRQDDFFRLGGHSLLATQLVSRLREALSLEVPIRVVFEHRVLAELALYLEQSHLQRMLPAITRISQDKPQALSFAQQRLWFIEQLLPNAGLYHNPVSIRILGELNVGALAQALNAMVARHEILRTVIMNSEGIAFQKVLPEDTGFALKESMENLEDREAFIKKPFQFDSEPLCRGLLLKQTEKKHVLLLVFHHIVMDDWSMGIFYKELNIFYNAYSENKSPSMPPLAVQYIDYSIWQRNWLQGEILEKQLRYWQEQLKEVATLELPTDYPRPKELSYQGGFVHRKFSKELLNQLQTFSQSRGVTLFMSLVASIQGFLSRYCNQTDIAIGTPIANRNIRATEGLIGFFINTLVLRNQLGDNPSFETVIKRVENTTLSAYEHQDVPFEQLVEYLQVSRELNRNPLFQVMFTLHPEVEKFQLGDLEVLPEENPEHLSRFDLLINAFVEPEGLYLKFDYAKELFTEERIERLADYYETFLSALLKEPSKRLSEIPLVGEQERKQLSLWNATQHEYPKNKNIHQLFEEQVKSTPFNVAVVYEDQEISYQELNARANQLAHFLREQGIGPDKLVAIAMERSVEMVVSILGILKAGGAYLPMDPFYPEERLTFMLEDTGSPFLITQMSLKKIFDGYNKILYIDEDWQEIRKRSQNNPPPLTLPQHLAYVIYTSGSTGKPKGVMIGHQNLTHYITYAQRTYPLSQGLSLFHGSYAFDMSITSLFLPLVQGCSIGIVSRTTDVEELGEFIKAHDNLNLMKLTPTHLRALKDQLSESDIQKQKGTLIIGGEKLVEEDIGYWKQSPERYIVNEYGPTETTVGCCIYKIEKENKLILIGRPIDNTEIYILDKGLQSVPIGVIGEIYIGGAGLARGYFGRPGLTAERFIPNPFSENARLYKTGDLARYLEGGNIEFLGRSDDQVKVRGYRIEVGEIEIALSSHQDISEVVVIAREDEPGIKKLVAYVVPGEFTPSPTELREYLEKILPDYMVPSFFVYLKEIPFTLNGKVDRNALPSPDTFSRSLEDEYVAPRNEREQALSEIWSTVLGIERVGIRDHFFRIGGDSIISIQLVSKARQQGIRFSVKDVFNHPTIEALASVSHTKEEPEILQTTSIQHFDFNSAAISQKIFDLYPGKKISVEGAYPLSPLQAGLLFHALYEPDSDAYFIQSVLKIKGEVNKEALQKAWQKVCDHHAILRTAVLWEGLVKPLQYILAKVEVPFEIENWQELTLREQEERLTLCIEADRQRSFELRKAPLFRIKLIDCAKDRAYMIWSSHHMLLDGWSTPIILGDVLKAYEDIVIGKELTLKHRVPYKDYINYLEKQDKEKARDYWQKTLSSVEGPTRLSFKRVLKEVSPSKDYGTHEIELSIEETKAIQGFASEKHVTLNTVLQGAVGLLLQHYSQKTEVVMGVTVSGRTIDLAGIEEMVGLFINTLPLKITCHREDTIGSYLNHLQEQTQQINEHSNTPLSQIYGWTSQHEGLFDVLFVFENYPIEEVVSNGTQSFQITNIKGIERTEYPLTIVVVLGKKINFIFHYQTEHFDKAAIELIAKHLETLLKSMQQSNGAPRTLPYLSNDERQQLVQAWNATEKSYPIDKTLQRLFEEQVERTPNNIAIVYRETRLTYLELNDRANQLAHYIMQADGFKSDTLIALCLGRNEHMLIGILAVLKAGAAYVPLDPSYPDERIKYILEDAGIKIILTNAISQQRLTNLINISMKKPVKIIGIDSAPIQGRLLTQSIANPITTITSRHLAYVMYTSGTTGNPKGVMVEHLGIVNTLFSLNAIYDFSKGNKVSEFTSYVFDVSVSEIFTTLFRGGELHLLSEEVRADSLLISQYIINNEISYVYIPPILLSTLPKLEYKTLKGIVYAGEPCNAETGKYWSTAYKLYNYYGPTETTIYATGKQVVEGDTHLIGGPISNTKCYVLNEDLSLLPIGIVGELYIAGAGLARGYLNRPELTAERFIKNPFQTKKDAAQDKNAKLYKTGDLVRRLPDGNLEYIGRNDTQVKIRGYRIELGEIEAVLSNYTEVKQSVVLVKEHKELSSSDNNRKYLVGYYVAEAKLDETALQAYLSSRLPEYMIPSLFVYLDKLPLTINGKVDRKALPSPDFSSRSLSDQYVPPCNERERKLCEIWSAVLGIDKVGTRDHFFRMGGDSIISIQLVSKARQRGIKFSVKDVFNHPTVEALASVSQDEEELESLQQGTVSGEVPLSPIQKWYFEQNPANPHYYNQSMWFKSEEPVDVDRLQNALKAIYHHHDGFRLRYRKDNEGWKQYYVEESTLPWKVWQSGAKESLEKICTDLQSSLNIEHGPLSQLLWFKETGQLLWVIHHLIVDGVSWRILLEDLNLAYAGKDLGSKSHSYQDWSQSLSRYVAKGEIEYYQTQLQCVPRLATDFAYADYIALRDVQRLNIIFSEQTTKQFLQRAHQSYGTQPDDLLLLALVQAVGDCFGKYQLCLDLEGHGREDLGENLDLTRTLGWFTSLHPVVLTLPEPSDMEQSIKHIKEHLRKIPQKGVSYGILSYLQKTCAVVSGEILFNYLGQWSNIKRKEEVFFFGEGDMGLSASLDNPHSHPLAINGGVNQGQLEFHWSYSPHHYKTETIEKLSNAFKERLEALIVFCSEEKHYGYSPSDFPFAKLSAKQLDNLFKKLEVKNE